MRDTPPESTNHVAAADDGTPPTKSLISDPEWAAILKGESGHFASGRRIFRLIPSSPRCKLCSAPFHGFGAPVFRMLDRGPWQKNPSICGFCFKQLERAHGGAEIELTLLFADVRGSTALAESMGTRAFRGLLDRFYHEMTKVLLAHDAVIDKFVGDEVVALFIPALASADHARRGIEAAREVLRATGHRQASEPWIPVGVGVHSGSAYVGSIGDAVTDFTAIGDTVNVTARLASAAATGEILVSEDAALRAGLTETSETRTLNLRGRNEPLDVRVLYGEATKVDTTAG
jgi:adenylate cyclase